MQLHKRDVVEAATVILDNYGIADLTMRRLARELAITPGALYWHFANKQQLLGAVADQVLTPVCTESSPDCAVDWRLRIDRLSRGLRDALLSHTDGAELVSASFAAGQSRGVMQILQRLADAAGHAGLTGDQRELAARTVVYYVLGATADEQSRMQWDAAGASPDQPSLLLEASADPSDGFTFGLRLLIDGLAAQSDDRILDPVGAVPPA